MKQPFPGFLLLLVLCVSLAASAKAQNWEEVRHGGRPHVTLRSFCNFYQFRVPVVPDQEWFETNGPMGTLRMKLGSRDMYLNGARMWLSFPLVRSAEGPVLISKLDVVYLLDPILRPEVVLPRKVLRGVVVDPGHGGSDRGARTACGYTEKEANLDTALRLKKLLEDASIPLVMTRSRDVFVSLEERSAIANRHRDHVFVSIHYNAGPRGVHGIETYAMTPQGAASTAGAGRITAADMVAYEGNKHDFQNIVLTDLIHREMMKMHSPGGDRGIKRARFVVLRRTEIPAVLVEGGFMSAPVDVRIIRSESYRQKVAEAIFNGILAYKDVVEGRGLRAPGSPPATSPEPPPFREPAVIQPRRSDTPAAPASPESQPDTVPGEAPERSDQATEVEAAPGQQSADPPDAGMSSSADEQTDDSDGDNSQPSPSEPIPEVPTAAEGA